MQPEDRIRLKHIIEEAKEACLYVQDLSFEDFLQDGKTVRAVIRSIEIIGEAASKISMELREDYPDIPWQKIVGMRNRLIHVYFDIDHEVIWKTVQVNLPPLISKLEQMLKHSEN